MPAAWSWADVVRQARSTAVRQPATAVRTAAQRLLQAQQVLRCFQLERETYCLGLGFVDQRPSVARIATAAGTAAASTSGTGELSVPSFVAQRMSLGERARLTAELDELRTAWAGRQKALALRTGTYRAQAATPGAFYLMPRRTTSQDRSYWCGPATLQSIDWGNDGHKDSQILLAKALGTTSGGTGITAMVRQTNALTTWDGPAGPYITQGVRSWTWQKFFAVHQAQLGDGTPGPIIEHPQLLKRYFAYLAFDHSGHFQVGRGYSKATRTIAIFEVFNEHRFNRAGRVSAGAKNVPATAMFSATLANKYQNIGL